MKLSNLLSIFNRKSANTTASSTLPPMVPISNLGIGSRLSNVFGGIYNFFTDTGDSYDTLKILKLSQNYAVSDPIVASFLRVMDNNVVGHTGFSLQSKIDDSLNSEINSKVEYGWYDFTRQGNFEVSNRFSCADFLSQALHNYIVDGEIVIRIYNTGKYGVKLQLLNFSSIDYMRSGGNVLNGVEIGPESQPIAYWIKDGQGKVTRVDASNIIHIPRIPKDTANYRGLSLLAPVLPLLNDINTYKKAVITAAIKEATSVIYYKSNSNHGRTYEGASSVSDIANFRPGQTTVNNPSDDVNKAILGSLQSSSVRVGGFAIEALPDGVDIGQLNANHPSAATPAFQKAFYTTLASGLGVSYITLLMDLESANFSGARATAILERPTFKKFRAMLIEKVMEPVYKIWLTNYIKQNKKDFPMIDNSYDAYFEHDFMGLGWDYINPKDDTDSTVTACQNGLASFTEKLAERGIDIEDHIKTLTSSNETKLRELIKSFQVPAPSLPSSEPAEPALNQPETATEDKTKTEEEEPAPVEPGAEPGPEKPEPNEELKEDGKEIE